MRTFPRPLFQQQIQKIAVRHAKCGETKKRLHNLIQKSRKNLQYGSPIVHLNSQVSAGHSELFRASTCPITEPRRRCQDLESQFFMKEKLGLRSFLTSGWNGIGALKTLLLFPELGLLLGLCSHPFAFLLLLPFALFLLNIENAIRLVISPEYGIMSTFTACLRPARNNILVRLCPIGQQQR